MPEMKRLLILIVIILISSCNQNVTLLNILKGNSCVMPCWQNIELGVTSHDDAMKILSDISAECSKMSGGDAGQEIMYQCRLYEHPYIGRPAPALNVVGVEFEDGIVINIIMTANICVSSIITSFGAPDAVIADELINNFILVYYDFDYDYGITFYTDVNNPLKTTNLAMRLAPIIDIDSILNRSQSWEETYMNFEGECTDSFSQ